MLDHIFDYTEQDKKRKRTKVNNLNRKRSQSMERRIATYLGGYRVPMSGSGSIKGDVLVPITKSVIDAQGTKFDFTEEYSVECKYTARTDGDGAEMMLIDLKWFPKIEEEVRLMHNKFGILIMHFHLKASDLVFIAEKDYKALGGTEPSIDVDKLDGKYFRLHYRKYFDMLSQGSVRFRFAYSNYILLKLPDFKELVDAYQSGV